MPVLMVAGVGDVDGRDGGRVGRGRDSADFGELSVVPEASKMFGTGGTFRRCRRCPHCG